MLNQCKICKFMQQISMPCWDCAKSMFLKVFDKSPRRTQNEPIC